MTEPINLKPFCCDWGLDFVQYGLDKPHKLSDGRVCATNGRIIIACAPDADYEPAADPNGPPPMLQIAVDKIEHKGTEQTLDPWPDIKPRVCDVCDGEMRIECDECNGQRAYECHTCGQETDCESCDDGTMACRKCGGSGHKPVRIFGRLVDARYYLAVAGLPGPKCGAQIEMDTGPAIVFSGPDFFGAIMCMREPGE